MEPIAPTPSSPRGAAWLNGSIWALILAAFAYTLVLQDYKLSLPFLHAFALIVVGLLANLLMCLWLYAIGKKQQAKPYLLCFLALLAVGVGVGSWVFFFDPYAGC